MNALKSILVAVAPALATALGGPLAGAAVGVLSKKLLGKDNGSEEELIAAVQGASPEVLLQLKQLDTEFKKHIVDAALRLDEMVHDDRADARARDVEIRKATGNNDRSTWMIIGDLIGLVAVVFVLIFFKKEMPAEVAGILNVVAAGLVLCLRDAHTFEFGSSRGSKEKDELIAGMAKGE